MLGTKEFYDIMFVFEKYAQKNIRKGSMGLIREDKANWKNRYYYSDGITNDAFKLFLAGYSLGKANYIDGFSYE